MLTDIIDTVPTYVRLAIFLREKLNVFIKTFFWFGGHASTLFAYISTDNMYIVQPIYFFKFYSKELGGLWNTQSKTKKKQKQKYFIKNDWLL